MRLGMSVAFRSLHRTDILEGIMAASHSRKNFAACVPKVVILAAHDSKFP